MNKSIGASIALAAAVVLAGVPLRMILAPHENVNTGVIEDALAAASAEDWTEDGLHLLQTKAAVNRAVTTTRFEPVKVEVFYEMMCPACQFFFGNDLTKLWNDAQLKTLVDIKLYPFGNGQISSATAPDYKFECQHGAPECLGNAMQACAVKTLGTADKYMPFVLCMEKNAGAGPEGALATCSQESGVDAASITACSASQEAAADMFEIATHSNTVQPPREYTPWVTVGGVHHKEAEYGNFLGVICGALKAQNNGEALPEACSKVAAVAVIQATKVHAVPCGKSAHGVEAKYDPNGARPPACLRDSGAFSAV